MSEKYIETTSKCPKCGKTSVVGIITSKSHDDIIKEGYTQTIENSKYSGENFYDRLVIEECKECKGKKRIGLDKI